MRLVLPTKVQVTADLDESSGCQPCHGTCDWAGVGLAALQGTEGAGFVRAFEIVQRRLQ